MNRVLIFLSFLFILNSCDKSEVENSDLLIIGLSFGECLGDCNFLYKLEGGLLFADDCDFCDIPSDIKFQNNNITDSEKLDRIHKLKDQIPSELLLSSETIFGCPDCGDWGAIHVIVGEGKKHYTLDNNIEGNPENLRVFAREVRETVMFLMD